MLEIIERAPIVAPFFYDFMGAEQSLAVDCKLTDYLSPGTREP